MMNNGKSHESIQPMSYILCKKNNEIILENIIIKDIGEYINLLNEPMIFNNQHVSPSNIYVRGDLVFLVVLLGKEYSSLYWCIKCKSPSKYRKSSNHSMDDE